mmetsp:Transcript_17942/g.36431  ORF Transcript_17942/g.36431 Transcript_17942/m.36431 type:complete len:440 (-) Transcript_17942:39-1358(-)
MDKSNQKNTSPFDGLSFDDDDSRSSRRVLSRSSTPSDSRPSSRDSKASSLSSFDFTEISKTATFADEPVYRSASLISTPPPPALSRQSETFHAEKVQHGRTLLKSSSSPAPHSPSPPARLPASLPVLPELDLAFMPPCSFTTIPTSSTSSQTVGSRVMDRLVAAGCYVQNKRKTENVLKCTHYGSTDADRVVFYVNLYSSPKDSSTLVEVTRWSGSSLVFSALKRGVFSAAALGASAPPLTLGRPSLDSELAPPSALPAPTEGEVETALKALSGVARAEGRRYALCTLQQCSTSPAGCREILLFALPTLMALVSAEAGEYDDEELLGNERVLALSTLGNVAASEGIGKIVKDHWPQVKALLPELVNAASRPSTAPHEALLAITAIRDLMRSSPKVMRRLQGLEADGVLERAKAVAVQRRYGRLACVAVEAGTEMMLAAK